MNRYGDREDRTVQPANGLEGLGRAVSGAMSGARAQYDKASARKAQYEAVGLGFSDMANEYSKVSARKTRGVGR